MEDFAFCIRQWDANVGYAFDMKDGKKVYKQRLPRCHGEVAMANALVVLAANQAMDHGERIVFDEEHFKVDSTAVPGPTKKG